MAAPAPVLRCTGDRASPGRLRPQPFWDNGITPRLTVDPGDVVVIDCAEPIRQVTPDWTHEDFGRADESLTHALTGSIAVAGAEPGHVLQVEILGIRHKGWGWSGTAAARHYLRVTRTGNSV